MEHGCLECPLGTAIIDETMLTNDETYYTTAGALFKPDPYTCAQCPHRDMLFDEEFNCICREGFVIAGESSVGSQTCVDSNHIPSNFPSVYSKVKFNFVTSSKNDKASSSSIEVDSIIISHYYLEAASSCEFAQSDSERNRRGCQTLLNLCVLSSYDNTSAACRQLALLSSQTSILRNKLFYDDEVLDGILRDQNIEMQMSFGERENFEHTLDFRLAKYTVSGDFLGFQNIKKDPFLTPCSNNIGKSGRFNSNIPTTSDQILRFGRPFANDVHECSLGELMAEETLFYELYLVDKGAQCGDDYNSFECLYPIPVLTTNYIEDETFPNINKVFSDEEDDKFVKRFVALDNMVSQR